MAMAAIRIQSVRKHFGPVAVLHDVSIDIPDGSFTVLVGPSGCGKSTLLRMLAGLEDTPHGEIRVGDRVVNDLLPKERDMAMVFQSYALYPHMTVRENMGFSLTLARASADEKRRRVEDAARILDLEPLLGRFPRELSGGQRQRVAMGRAIVRDPQVFLFDEPLSNLDAKLRVQMRAEIKKLHQRLKTTTVYVTHDQIEAMTMADQIVVMRDGRIEQVGSPLDLFDCPVNRFVAQFIGSPSMNVLEGQIEPGTSLFRTAGTDWPVAPAQAAHAGRPLAYGIRPTDLRLAADGQGVPARVEVVEPTGAETELLVQVGSDTLTVLVAGRTPARPGDLVHLAVDLTQVHLFDGATQRRLVQDDDGRHPGR